MASSVYWESSIMFHSHSIKLVPFQIIQRYDLILLGGIEDEDGDAILKLMNTTNSGRQVYFLRTRSISLRYIYIYNIYIYIYNIVFM